MQSQGIAHINYDATTANHVSTTADVKSVALQALKNIQGGPALVEHVFAPKQNIDMPKRPPVTNMKMYGPYFFGR